jgi:hypothetical protein
MSKFRAIGSKNFSETVAGFSETVQSKIRGKIESLKSNHTTEASDACFPHRPHLKMKCFQVVDDDSTVYLFYLLWRYGEEAGTIELGELGVQDLGIGGSFENLPF